MRELRARDPRTAAHLLHRFLAQRNPPRRARRDPDAIAPPSNLTRFLDHARPAGANRSRFRALPRHASASSIFWRRPSPVPICSTGSIPTRAGARRYRHLRAQSLLRRRSASLSRIARRIGEPFQLEGGPLSDDSALRRFYRRQMLRIQSGSILKSRAHLRDAQEDVRPGG